MPHRHAYLERLEEPGSEVVSKHALDYQHERQFIGREHTTVVMLAHPAIARKHVMLEFGPLGRWWLADMGSSHGTWVNGTHLFGGRRLLEPGDLIRFDGHGHGDIVLRFGVEGWAPTDAHLRALIDAAPEDAARWEVWADFLEEQGDPLAQRVRGFGPSPGDLGVGNGHHWEHGFIARGVLTRTGRVFATLKTELDALLGSPFSRWMRALAVDLSSYQLGDEETAALQVLQALERSRPAALCELSLRLTHRPVGQRLRGQFDATKRALPGLQTGFDALVTAATVPPQR